MGLRLSIIFAVTCAKDFPFISAEDVAIITHEINLSGKPITHLRAACNVQPQAASRPAPEGRSLRISPS